MMPYMGSLKLKIIHLGYCHILDQKSYDNTSGTKQSWQNQSKFPKSQTSILAAVKRTLHRVGKDLCLRSYCSEEPGNTSISKLSRTDHTLGLGVLLVLSCTWETSMWTIEPKRRRPSQFVNLIESVNHICVIVTFTLCLYLSYYFNNFYQLKILKMVILFLEHIGILKTLP